MIFVFAFFVMFDFNRSFRLFGLFKNFRTCVVFLFAVALDSIQCSSFKEIIFAGVSYLF